MIFSQLLLHLVVILSAVSISNPLPHNQFQNPSLSSLIISGGSTSTKDDPFLNLSKLFEGTKYSQQEVHKALRNIAGNQATLKNMDGVTHQLQNSMGKSTSLKGRMRKFLSSKKRNLKEASKIVEYTTLVERALQACEILTATSHVQEDVRFRSFADAGLSQLSSFDVRVGRIVCRVSLLVPTTIPSHNDNTCSASNTTQSEKKQTELKYEHDELVIALTDVSFASVSPASARTKATRRAVLDLLRGCGNDQVVYLPLRSAGLVEEEVSVHKVVLKMATEILHRIGDHIALRTSSLKSPLEADSAIANSSNISLNSNHTTVIPRFASVRVVGYSLGASVGSFVTMLLDGGLNISLSTEALSVEVNKDEDEDDTLKNKKANKLNKKKKKSSKSQSILKTSDEKGVKSSLTSTISDVNMKSELANTTQATVSSDAPASISKEECMGLYSKRVQCLCISPFPCISRVIVPQYVSSLICGDDIVPRATPEAMTKLRTRLREALRSGAGKGSLSWSVGGAWLNDMKYLAESGISMYASGSHDVSSLTVPGRVFYIKARKLKKGASVQRVFRGNWREDMLWLLHEILLSDRMFAHHDLIYTAQVLSRI